MRQTHASELIGGYQRSQISAGVIEEKSDYVELQLISLRSQSRHRITLATAAGGITTYSCRLYETLPRVGSETFEWEGQTGAHSLNEKNSKPYLLVLINGPL